MRRWTRVVVALLLVVILLEQFGIVLPKVLSAVSKAIFPVLAFLSIVQSLFLKDPLLQLRDKTVAELFGGQARKIPKRLQKASTNILKAYYEGGGLTWAVIGAGGDVRRTITSQIDDWMDHENSDRVKLVLLWGRPGAGKSTLAWRYSHQLASKLSAQLIHIVRSEDDEFWNKLHSTASELDTKTIVLIDDVFKYQDAVSVLSSLPHNPRITIIATSQQIELPDNVLNLEKRLNNIAIFLAKLLEPDDEEARAIPKKLEEKLNIKEFNSANIGALRRKSAQIEEFISVLTTGEPTHVRAQSRLRILKDKDIVVYRAYEYVCLASQFDLSFPPSLFVDLGFPDILARPATQEYFYKDARGGISAINRPTARASVELYSQERAPYDLVSTVFDKINSKNHAHRLFLFHLIRVMLLSQTLGDSAKRLLVSQSKYIEAFLSLDASRFQESGSWARISRQAGLVDEARKFEQTGLKKSVDSVGDVLSIKFILDTLEYESIRIELLKQCEAWFEKNPGASFAWIQYASLLRHPKSSSYISDSIDFLSGLLTIHGAKASKNAWALYVALARQSADSAQSMTLVSIVSKYLATQKRDDAQIWISFLSFLTEAGKSELVSKALIDSELWMGKYGRDSGVWAAYIALLKARGDHVQQLEIVESELANLSKSVSFSHTELLRLEATLPVIVSLLKIGFKKQSIPQLNARWMNAREVSLREAKRLLEQFETSQILRAAYIALTEHLGTSDEQAECITDTISGLRSGRYGTRDTNVWQALFSLLQHAGTQLQKLDALEYGLQIVSVTNPSRAGLAADNLVSQIDIASAIYKLLKDMADVISAEHTARWELLLKKGIQVGWDLLRLDPDDETFRSSYASLIGRFGEPAAKRRCIQETIDWLKAGNLHSIGIAINLFVLLRKYGQDQAGHSDWESEYQWAYRHGKTFAMNARAEVLGEAYSYMVIQLGTQQEVSETCGLIAQWDRQTPHPALGRAYWRLRDKLLSFEKK